MLSSDNAARKQTPVRMVPVEFIWDTGPNAALRGQDVQAALPKIEAALKAGRNASKQYLWPNLWSKSLGALT